MDALLELKLSLPRRGTIEGRSCRPEAVLYGLLPEAGLGAMVCENIRIPLSQGWKLALQYFDDARVKLRSLTLEQSLINSVLHESMLEGVYRIRDRSPL